MLQQSAMIAFVTGASSGFGAAIARRLVKEGAHVVAASRRVERLELLASELGSCLLPLVLDVRDGDAVEQAVASLPTPFRAVDVLVNSAGLALGIAPAHEASGTDWATMIDTNAKGLALVTHALLPGMVERNRGQIINLGSIAGSFPYPGGNVYGATKAFVEQFTLGLRADLLGTRIRVTNIAPGMCGGTEFSEVRFHGDRARAAQIYQGVRYLTAEDISDTIWWVLTRPEHMNVNRVEVMPVQQAFGPLAVSREG